MTNTGEGMNTPFLPIMGNDVLTSLSTAIDYSIKTVTFRVEGEVVNYHFNQPTGAAMSAPVMFCPGQSTYIPDNCGDDEEEKEEEKPVQSYPVRPDFVPSPDSPRYESSSVFKVNFSRALLSAIVVYASQSDLTSDEILVAGSPETFHDLPWPDDEHPDNDVNEPLLDPQVDSPHQWTPTSEQGNYITARDYQHVYGVTPATNNLMGTSCVSGVFVDPTKTETTAVSVEGVLHT